MQHTMSRSILTVLAGVTVFAVASGAGPATLDAQEPDGPAARKVAFLYNFVRLTEWPADTDPTRTICVLGDGPVAREVSSLDGKTARGKTIVTRVVRDTDSADACHLLFVADSRNEAATIGDAPILTVGNGAGFARAGGMICLHEDGNRLSIDINLDVVRDHRLRLDPQLLALARVIRSDSTGAD